MADYFKWIYTSVHAGSPDGDGLHNPSGMGTVSNSNPWYILSPPAVYPILPTYKPSYFQSHKTFDILIGDIQDNLHFSAKMEETGCEGLYGIFYYVQLPDIEIGLNFDVGAFLAGALSCTLLGYYLDDIYYPRRLMSWWPTRWFFHFVEEGIYLQRSLKWFSNAVVILIKIVYRAGYGGLTHTASRMFYYWLRKLIFTGRDVPYYPLFDDTFAALVSGYLWTSYTVETDRHTAWDRVIATGWVAIFAGLVEYGLYQYFLKDPPPGLFRWLFGGAYYDGGVFRYLRMGRKPGEF